MNRAEIFARWHYAEWQKKAGDETLDFDELDVTHTEGGAYDGDTQVELIAEAGKILAFIDAHIPVTRTVHYVNVTAGGYDAAHWLGSYEVLRDALHQELGQFFFDDDCAEEAIFCEGIERLGRMLAGVTRDDENGGFTGTVYFDRFWGPAEAKGSAS